MNRVQEGVLGAGCDILACCHLKGPWVFHPEVMGWGGAQRLPLDMS